NDTSKSIERFLYSATGTASSSRGPAVPPSEKAEWSEKNGGGVGGKKFMITFGKLFEYNVFFFQAEDGIRYLIVTGVQTCALPIFDPALRVSKGHERVDEPPRRIRSDCRVRRMLVDLRRAAGHLDVQDAFASELDFRS